MPIHCIQAPLINRMHSQSTGGNVRTMVLILNATATRTANAGGRNGANECDCNTELPYFECQYLLNGVCVCVISLLAILKFDRYASLPQRIFPACLFIDVRKKCFHQKYNLSP